VNEQCRWNRRNAFRRTPHHRPLLALAPGPGLKPVSGAIRESAEVAAEAEVDVVGTGDDRVDVQVRACARRLVDGLHCGDDYLVVKMMMTMMLFLLVLVMSAGPCVDVDVYLHFLRVRVNRDENVWEMR
jgi:hypothetical protein